ncbi:hypothetical protein A2V71_00170 [Candidatus Berkelbacteria bacterium RBG_13_40_8]|uniref:Uncharacterized protein n=1 Tax=Candidatus Berkelbacteria bacterium RBG_13_40_8 TaxID=1797467 RepID=A0A1F5DNB2_9BACT|nr:MAG: hypothetical protein A2V71_00170 [Candidatus Berkelbacteria bacterium RBG_13_40_8]
MGPEQGPSPKENELKSDPINEFRGWKQQQEAEIESRKQELISAFVNKLPSELQSNENFDANGIIADILEYGSASRKFTAEDLDLQSQQELLDVMKNIQGAWPEIKVGWNYSPDDNEEKVTVNFNKEGEEGESRLELTDEEIAELEENH